MHPRGKSSLSMLRVVLCFALVARVCYAQSCLDEIQLPPGFSIASFGGGKVWNARSLTLSKADNGGKTLVYVSTRDRTNVYALIDEDGDGVADQIHTVIDDKDTPNGVAWRDGSLFVAEIDKIWRYDNADKKALAGKMLGEPVLVSDAFPTDRKNGWKFIAFGPDDRLYVPIGAPCNVCELEKFGDITYGSINRMNPDGTELESFAYGIRNTVGFDWHPRSKELWFTDNGRDEMGENSLDDELNKAFKKGLDFGFPTCHTEGIGNPYDRSIGKAALVNDPDIANKTVCKSGDSQQALQSLGPHVGALGMRFYTGDMFPESYKNSAFIAEHGSWNRLEAIGYRVVRVKFTKNGRLVTGREDFAAGWLLDTKTGEACGRPVDVLELPDGSLLVSDDFANDVYRISYSEEDAKKAKAKNEESEKKKAKKEEPKESKRGKTEESGSKESKG
ncbi:hypothetical protein BSKO_07694 [Bryopsis sp. KO-2023]|nr:hypothetical protein BSKO_07694 [Bryopsis sp. KO-2023]